MERLAGLCIGVVRMAGAQEVQGGMCSPDEYSRRRRYVIRVNDIHSPLSYMSARGSEQIVCLE